MLKTAQSFFLRYEKLIVAVVFLLFWFLLSYTTYFHQISGQAGDTTFATQILYNFRHTFSMESTFAQSIMDSFDHVWYQTAEFVCSSSLQLQTMKVPWGHFYLVMYLFIPFVKLFDVQVVVAVSHAGAYASVLLFTYILARMKKFSILNSALFTILASQHPLWEGGLQGQFYFNRFFLPFSALILLVLEKNNMKYRYIFLFIASLLAASTNEIYGISVFMILLSYMWIYRKWNVKTLLMAGLFLVMSFIMLAFIQNSVGKVTQTSFIRSTFGEGVGTMVRQLYSNVSNPKTMQFMTVNILFIGIFSLFNIRLVPAFFFILAPNIFVSVGGAEKTGWSTHYHMGYFIPLIWLSVLGLQLLNKRVKLQTTLIISAILLSFFLNPLDLTLLPKSNVALKRWFNTVSYYWVHNKYESEFRQRIRDAVGDRSVSVPEAIAYNLYDRDVYYYPVNIDSVGAVIFRYDELKIGDDRYYSINYGHQDPLLDTCIRDRMRRNGFDFLNPTIVNGWVVIKKQ